MNEVRPKSLVYRGRIMAAGLLVDPGIVPESAARSRIIRAWEPGTQVYRLGSRLLVRFPSPRAIRCGEADGLPLVEIAAGALCSAPLTPAERRAADLQAGTIAWVRDGTLQRETLDRATREDPAAWLDPSSLTVVPTFSLGAPPQPVEVLVEPAKFDSREKLGRGAATTAEAKAVFQAIQDMRAGKTPAGAGKRDQDSLAAAFARGRSWLAGRVKGTAIEKVLEGPPPVNPLMAAGHRALAQFLRASRLNEVIGRAQARYLGEMLDLFERGDLAAALRHAIPLAGEGEGGGLPALTTPKPRPDLNISTGAPGRGTSINVAAELMAHLKSLYRQAFERLEQAGRIDEAAFVLAELLQANEEAVAFLERHERFRLAAELAESRRLDAALIVRQWILAGEPVRAVLIARRTGAFAGAIVRLEKSHPDLAETLRREWAERLADAGDYAGAVEALWPLEALRPAALPWIDQAIALGGPAAGRMLARKIGLLPQFFPSGSASPGLAQAAQRLVAQRAGMIGDPFSHVREQALVFLRDEDPEAGAIRLALGEGLLRESPTPEVSLTARLTARALAADADPAPSAELARCFPRLVQLSGDAVLRTDVPQLPPPISPNTGDGTLRLSIGPTDVGALPIYDAAFLPNGRLLLALGEAGVRLVTRDGKTAAHFPQPAHYLAVAEKGHQAIGLARRGTVYRLSRLDLATFRSESWCEAALTAFCPDYDGGIWFAAGPEDGFMLVDPTAAKWSAIWRMRELGGVVRAMARSAQNCTLLIQADDWQRWTYSLPGPVLRYREIATAPAGEGVGYLRAVSAGGKVVDLTLPPPDIRLGLPAGHVTPTVSLFGRAGAVALGSTLRETQGPVLNDERLALVLRRDDGLICQLHKVAESIGIDPSPSAEVRLYSAGRAAVRLQDGRLVLADDRGRVLVADTATGQVLRNLRIS